MTPVDARFYLVSALLCLAACSAAVDDVDRTDGGQSMHDASEFDTAFEDMTSPDMSSNLADMRILDMTPSVPDMHILDMAASAPDMHSLDMAPNIPDMRILDMAPSAPDMHILDMAPSVPDMHILDMAPSVPDMNRVDAETPISQDLGTSDPCERLGDRYVEQTNPPSNPPYWGTLFVDDGLIIDSDPSSFRGLSYAGEGDRLMFDRRTNTFEFKRAHLFIAQFGEDKQVEVQVNPEMSVEEGEQEANTYCQTIGQLPAFLFRDLDTIWLHRGNNLFGGGNRNLLIHTGQGQNYIAEGLLAEVFLHEATHTSFDSYHWNQSLWLDAQNADGQAISTYAADFPSREDLAETIPVYLAVRFWRERISQNLYDTVMGTIPNRIRYLDCQLLTVDILQ